MTKSPLYISIPRADYVGYWTDFVHENAAFVPDHELTRLERALRDHGVAIHTAATNGDFHMNVVPAPAPVEG